MVTKKRFAVSYTGHIYIKQLKNTDYISIPKGMITAVHTPLQFIPLNPLIFVNNKLAICHNIRLKLIGKLEEKKIKMFINSGADKIIINLNLANQNP